MTQEEDDFQAESEFYKQVRREFIFLIHWVGNGDGGGARSEAILTMAEGIEDMRAIHRENPGMSVIDVYKKMLDKYTKDLGGLH